MHTANIFQRNSPFLEFSETDEKSLFFIIDNCIKKNSRVNERMVRNKVFPLLQNINDEYDI